MKKEQWIDKMKDKNNLVWINNEDIHIKDMVCLIWEMYDDDFNLTIEEMCNILLCERRWVVDNIKNNVKHIFLNQFIRKCMKAYGERDISFLKDYYFFSRSDFNRWLKENTIIERQTISIDLGEYSTSPTDLKIILSSYDNALSKCKTKLDRGIVNIQYYAKINENLTSDGKRLFSYRANEYKRNAEYIEIHEPIPKRFTSLKHLKIHYGNNELIYRKLYKHGAIRYTIRNSKSDSKSGLVRYDYNCFKTNGGIYNITVPYDIFLYI